MWETNNVKRFGSPARAVGGPGSFPGTGKNTEEKAMANYLMLGEGFDPYANLAYEEKLMELIRPGDTAMYLWQNQNTVVIGRNQNAWKECKCDLLEREDGRLARRSSGGGAVFHDLGNLNFTFAASPEAYDQEKQLSVVLAALAPLGVQARFSGRNDLIAMDGRKFSGNAFRHTKTCSMQHGTLLVCVDMQRLGRYLNPPLDKMRAKGVDSVRARVCNLTELRRDLTVEMLRESLVRSYLTLYGEAQLLEQGRFDIEELYARNASWAWNYGLTPEFDVRLEHRFSWGGLELMLRLKQGEVALVKAYSDAMDAEIGEKLERLLHGKTYGKDLSDALRGRAGLEDVADWLEKELPR